MKKPDLLTADFNKKLLKNMLRSVMYQENMPILYRNISDREYIISNRKHIKRADA